MKKKIYNELKELCDEGMKIIKEMGKDVSTERLKVQSKYQKWFTKSLNVVKTLLPNRYNEFYECYKLDKRKEVNFNTFRIYDYFACVGINKTSLPRAISHFFIQINILESIRDSFDSLVFNITENINLEIMDNELKSSKILLKKGFLRAAGAISGVVLEKHFANIEHNHNLKILKKDPSISDYNDFFKKENIYDTIQWRFIQRLGDIRNLCDHNKDREPTKEEVQELIDGVDKIIKTVF